MQRLPRSSLVVSAVHVHSACRHLVAVAAIAVLGSSNHTDVGTFGNEATAAADAKQVIHIAYTAHGSGSDFTFVTRWHLDGVLTEARERGTRIIKLFLEDSVLGEDPRAQFTYLFPDLDLHRALYEIDQRHEFARRYARYLRKRDEWIATNRWLDHPPSGTDEFFHAVASFFREKSLVDGFVVETRFESPSLDYLLGRIANPECDEVRCTELQIDRDRHYAEEVGVALNETGGGGDWVAIVIRGLAHDRLDDMLTEQGFAVRSFKDDWPEREARLSEQQYKGLWWMLLVSDLVALAIATPVVMAALLVIQWIRRSREPGRDGSSSRSGGE